jgi:hypothetical protein
MLAVGFPASRSIKSPLGVPAGLTPRPPGRTQFQHHGLIRQQKKVVKGDVTGVTVTPVTVAPSAAIPTAPPGATPVAGNGGGQVATPAAAPTPSRA